jgi:hypothetical protein
VPFGCIASTLIPDPTIGTFAILFAPKVLAIYKDASGLIAQRISDSKASASELSRSAQTGRTIKELAQVPIRLMDRVTLRTYVYILEKELNTAKAALATLDANEGVLAGGGGYVSAAFTSGNTNGGMNGAPRSKVSSHDVGLGFGTPTNASRAGMQQQSGPTLSGGRAYVASTPTVTGSSPRAAAGAGRDLARSSSSMITKYVVGSNGTPPSSQLGSSSFNVRGSSSVAPSPAPTKTTFVTLPTTNGGASSSSSALMVAMTGTSSRQSGNAESKGQMVPSSPPTSDITSSAAPLHNNNESPLPVTASLLSSLGGGVEMPRFRMPTATSPGTTPQHPKRTLGSSTGSNGTVISTGINNGGSALPSDSHRSTPTDDNQTLLPHIITS